MKSIFLPILLVLLCASSVSANPLTVLQLNSRPAEEVIPVLEPFLGPGEKISGQGFKILLRASPETVAELRELIASLDVAAKTLMISVFQGRESDLRDFDFSASIRIENSDISGSINASDNQADFTGGPLHRVRVNEGSEGFIYTGMRSGLYAKNEVNLASGFYVLPRINGDRVTLQISSTRENASTSQRSIDTLQATTILSGRLGEWLPLGGADERGSGTSSEGIGQRSSGQNQQDGIWVRADLVR